MKQLNQNDIMTVAGGVYLSGLDRNFNTVGLSTACQNAFRVESNAYSADWMSNTQFKTGLAKCTNNDARQILNRLATPTNTY